MADGRVLGRRRLGLLAAIVALALVATTTAWAGPIGYSVMSNGDDHLYAIDLATGAATDLGRAGFGDAEGLEFVGAQLLAIGGTVNELWDLTPPVPGTKIGDTGARSGIDAGLGYDATSGKLYNVNGGAGASLYEINILTGAATLVGSSNTFLDGLAITPSGVAYGADFIYTDALHRVDLSSGGTTLVGSMGISVNDQCGLAYDAASSTLYALDSQGRIYTLSTSTGAASYVANVTLGGQQLSGFEGLAIQADIIPEPASVALLAGGVLALLRRRRRS